MTLQQETTEWDDVLTKFGIKNQDQHATTTPKGELQKPSDSLSDEDEDDEEVYRKYREKRIAELMATMLPTKTFGDVEEITGHEFVEKVSKAGDGVQVVLHLYKPGVVTCNLINRYMDSLSNKYPRVKFLKSISTLCIANFPDSNLPGLLLYRNGQCQKQIFGPHSFPANLTIEDLEWLLHKNKAIESDLEEDPRKSRQKGSKFFERQDDSSDEDS